MKQNSNPLADPDNWILMYSEADDTHFWAYTGPEAAPWMLTYEEEQYADHK